MGMAARELGRNGPGCREDLPLLGRAELLSPRNLGTADTTTEPQGQCHTAQ